MNISKSPYFGGPKIKALQKARDAQVSELKGTSGAVIHGRTFSSDDPKALGWLRLREAMASEGMIALRGVNEATIELARQEFLGFNPVLHRWDIYMATSTTVRTMCTPLAQASLPKELICVPESEVTAGLAHDVQRFLTEQGVSPFSKDALLGKLFPARLAAFRHIDGRIAAAGFAAMTHNQYSPFSGTAWVGLIAVDPEIRGLGLGKHLNAICNLTAVNELAAHATMAFVARDNLPSRAMLESCGLKSVDGKSVVLFSTSTDRISR